MEKMRKPFQGVVNILSFNRHYYMAGLGFMLVLFASRVLINWSPVVFWLIAGAFLYGLIMPLIVSAIVYDFSGYYTLEWLKKLIPGDEGLKLMVNINAGFDETSYLIKKKFPHPDLRVFDFYNPRTHTEPAIKRARKVSWTYPGTQTMASDTIPIPDRSADTVLLLSAAHEIRSGEERVEFLRECFRICKPGGKVIMVEHLRDFPNFLAFSIGFTHFFSRAAWKNAFRRAGFGSINETKFTPFMSIFHCQPHPEIVK